MEHKDYPCHKVCKNVFMDLGTNVGDSIGVFVDHVLDVCTPPWLEKDRNATFDSRSPPALPGRVDAGGNPPGFQGERPHRAAQRQPGGTGGLVHWRRWRRRRAGDLLRVRCCRRQSGLHGTADQAGELHHGQPAPPRPVAHAHIFTESIVTSTDGPATMYLDMTSVNFNVSASCTSVCLVCWICTV